jgi:hypothetical protein
MRNRTLSPFRGTLAVMLVVLVLSPAHAATLNQASGGEQQFASVIDDLPLMTGLKPVEDSDVLFVEPHEGRIAETEASGAVDIDEVYNFYRRSLPHLGWKVIDGRTYEREGERLLIDARADGRITTVRFSVKPAS